MGATSQSSGGLSLASLGALQWEPTVYDHDDSVVLALEDAPFEQTEWPIPLPTGKNIMVGINSRPTEDGVPPFIPIDWRNPDPKKYPISNRGFVQARPQNYVDQAIAKSSYPDAIPPYKRNNLGYSYNLLEHTLAPVVDAPFVPPEYVLPKTKPLYPISFINTKQLEIPGTPFVPIEFRNPDLTKKQNTGFVQARPQFYTEPTAPPSTVSFWPAFQRKPGIMVDITTKVGDTPPEEPIGNGFISQNARKIVPALTWLQARPQYYTDIKPFNQNDWPNPRRKFIAPPTFVSVRQIEPQILNPFVNIDYPIPGRKKEVALTWTYFGNLQQIFTSPLGRIFDVPNPGIKKLQTLSWLNPTPSYYSAVVGPAPFNQTNWPNPLKGLGLMVFISSRFVVSDTTKPFNQTDWPLPRRVKRGWGWIDYFAIDDNLPDRARITFVPLRKRPFVPTYLFSPQIAQAVIPPRYDFSNPIIVKQQNKGYLLNLLQSTLDPGVSAKPFNQNDYPNPLIGMKNFHSGWIQDKKTYYTEEPLQPAQYDWPIFRAPKRNQTGFIRTTIPPADNFFTQITAIPVLRLKKTEGWIDISHALRNPPVAGVPFNQTVWPIFRQLKRFDILTILGQNYIILPQTTGRSICLLAALDEFDLFAMLDTLEFDATLEEFDLDAGGSDCE